MTENSSITAIILAGQRPGIDTLAQAFGQKYKALIPLGGQPMLLYVLGALKAAPNVASIRIAAQDIVEFGSISDCDIYQSANSIASTVSDLVHAMSGPLLITTADHALLTPAMIKSFIMEAQGNDLAIALVEKQSLLASYPESKRTWLKFRGGQYSGANLFWIGSKNILPVLDIWQSVEQSRKKGWTLLAAFGPLFLLGAALRILSLKTAFKFIGNRYKISIAPVILSQAEACIDVDTLEDHIMVENILQARRTASNHAPVSSE